MLDFINFYIIPGVVLGSIYALGAVGITLTFGILRFANFAHGESMTVGAYLTLALMTFTTLPIWVVVPFVIVLCMGLALGVDRLFYKPFRHSPSIILTIASFGVMLMIQSAVQFIWGSEVRSYNPGTIHEPIILFDALRIAYKHIVIIVWAVILVLSIHLLLTQTKLGKAMRAMSDSPELARLTGISTEFIIKCTWLLGSTLAVMAGVFLGIDTHLESIMGFQLLIPMFAAAILGGIGKPYGAIVGGYIIGIAEELSTYSWIGEEALIEPGYKSGVAFAIMIAMLLWRPSGLFKGKVL